MAGQRGGGTEDDLTSDGIRHGLSGQVRSHKRDVRTLHPALCESTATARGDRLYRDAVPGPVGDLHGRDSAVESHGDARVAQVVNTPGQRGRVFGGGLAQYAVLCPMSGGSRWMPVSRRGCRSIYARSRPVPG
jgi:hypothetical protein